MQTVGRVLLASLWAFWLLAGCTGTAVRTRPEAPGGSAEPMVFRVRPRTLNRIDERLFGQFMERPSWGEHGAEDAVIPGTHELQPGVQRLIREMKPPILRFPGGTDVDYLDWCDLIDNAPGRSDGRPVSVGHLGNSVTNHFGLDEFLRLAQEIGSEPLLVVNLRDAVMGKRPVAEAARHAAALVAYCNAPVGGKLPQGMESWAAVRAQNGRAKPYGVKYIQIGNEPWVFLDELKKISPEHFEDQYVDAIVAHIKAIREVDPTVQIIVHYLPGVTEKTYARVGHAISYLAGHKYAGGPMGPVRRDGREVPAESLTSAEVWYAWAALPDTDDQGLSTIQFKALTAAPEMGAKVAFTEWNWNGYWPHGATHPVLGTSLAGGVGAASYLHALMRRGGVIEIATQSMLVGSRWGLTAIRVDPTGRTPAYYRPCGMATMLYGHHHGARLLDLHSSGVPSYQQRLEAPGIKPAQVAMVDALATASDHTVFFHAINRHFDQALEATVDLSELGRFRQNATQYLLEGRLNDEPQAGEPLPVAHIRAIKVRLEGNQLRVTLPPRSVSVVEFERQ